MSYYMEKKSTKWKYNSDHYICCRKILIEKKTKNFKSKLKSRLKSPSSEKGNIICLNELNIVS